MQVKAVYTGVAMMGFLHLYLKYTQPLFIQALMGLKGLYDSKEIQIHLFGQPAKGELERPFKAAPGLFGREHIFARISCSALTDGMLSFRSPNGRQVHQGG